MTILIICDRLPIAQYQQALEQAQQPQLTTSNPSKRLPPTERGAIFQRSKKLKSRFFYRRTKGKGAQICYTGPVKCPSKLLHRVATKLKQRLPTDRVAIFQRSQKLMSRFFYQRTKSKGGCSSLLHRTSQVS
jgi:hypothetical protein